MNIKYLNRKVEKQCTDLKEAKKLFGGNEKMAISLFSRINAIEQAPILKDIIFLPNFRFHSLRGKLDGMFSIDVKTKKDKWRLILRPLDDDEEIFDPCNIDEIADTVTIVEIREVSPHYE